MRPNPGVVVMTDDRVLEVWSRYIRRAFTIRHHRGRDRNASLFWKAHRNAFSRTHSNSAPRNRLKWHTGNQQTNNSELLTSNPQATFSLLHHSDPQHRYIVGAIYANLMQLTATRACTDSLRSAQIAIHDSPSIPWISFSPLSAFLFSRRK